MGDTWAQFLATGKVPDFPEKGRYRAWDKAWNPIGYADEPQHKGQQPARFPPDWSPEQCFLASNGQEAR